MSFSRRFGNYLSRVESALEQWLPAATQQPESLHKAMRYAVLGGGKRIRPVLVYATGAAFGAKPDQLDGPACAVEMIHAYSLVHDDLPAMDNDDLRRGRPTCHREFGEATAILAGDALQALAFHVLAGDTGIRVNAPQRTRMIDILATASGSRGMAGGQAIDLGAVGRNLDLSELQTMHAFKTGALIRASVELGALCCESLAPADFESASRYGRCIGLAFQIQDDILDIECDTETLGKRQGADMARDKPTFPRLLGMEEARQAARELHDEAVASLRDVGRGADELRWIAEYIVERRN